MHAGCQRTEFLAITLPSHPFPSYISFCFSSRFSEGFSVILLLITTVNIDCKRSSRRSKGRSRRKRKERGKREDISEHLIKVCDGEGLDRISQRREINLLFHRGRDNTFSE